MTDRRKFLESLFETWCEDGTINRPLTIEDLLDDAAYLGLPGASEAYLAIIAPKKKIILRKSKHG